MAKPVYFGLSISALKEKLQKDPAGAYVFYGAEELLKHFYLEKLEKLIEKEGAAEFNLARLDFSRTATLDTLEEEMGILPMMAPHRLIICRGLDLLHLSEKNLQRLIALCRGTSSDQILVIFLSAEEMIADKAIASKKAVKLLSEAANFVGFPLQEEKTLLSWSAKILAADHLSASQSALKTLFLLTGGKMSTIRLELEKLAMYAISQGRDTILPEDITLIVEGNPEYAFYQLTDAVLAGSFASTEKIIDSLKKQDAEPTVIIAALSRMFVNCLICTSGAEMAEALRAAGMQDWQFRNLSRACHGKKRSSFETALALCLDCDKRIKGVRSDAFLVCETLCIRLCRLCGEHE